MVTTDDPQIGALLQQISSEREQAVRLSELGMLQFRARFCAACEGLGIGKMLFKPYSIRRGGACYDFRHHSDLQRTLFRGRWDNVRTGCIYITDGLSLLTEIR